MDKEVERAKKFLDSKGYEVSRLDKNLSPRKRILQILKNHHQLMERLK